MSVVTPREAMGEGWTIVDVRSATERAVVSVAGSLHVPLEQMESAGIGGERVALLCKGGTRARMAQERLARLGVRASVIDGGMDRWVREGLPVVRTSRNTWALERQVRFVAGLLVFVSTVAAVTWSLKWLWFTGFVGCGLMFSGVSDICMMGNLLAKMPWNRVRSAT